MADWIQWLSFGLYDNQLSVISKSSQGESFLGRGGSQSGCKRSQEWQVFSVNCVGRESFCSLSCRDVCTSGGVSQVFAAGMFPVVKGDDHSGSVLCCAVLFAFFSVCFSLQLRRAPLFVSWRCVLC